jgi:hypothetical protein
MRVGISYFTVLARGNVRGASFVSFMSLRTTCECRTEVQSYTVAHTVYGWSDDGIHFVIVAEDCSSSTFTVLRREA